MKKIVPITLALFFYLPQAYAQTPELDTLQIERLARLCQLWGHTHFFHPSLAYRDLPFDSAFAAAVPKVISAEDAGAYARAIGEMFAVLDDPATRVELENVPQEGEFSAGERHPTYRFDPDSVLIVTLHNYHDLSDWNLAIEKFAQIAGQLPAAKGVLFDLRTDQPTLNYHWVLEWGFKQSGLEAALTDIPLVTPGSRSRMHDGFAPEDGSTSGGYYSAFYVRDGKQIIPAPGARPLPAVFLINRNSFLPAVALGMQAAGKGGVIAHGETTDAIFIGTKKVDMGENVQVHLRDVEMLSSNGSVGMPLNRTFSKNMPDEEVLRTALDFLKKGDFRLSPAAASPPMVAVPTPGSYSSDTYPDLGYRMLAAAKTWAVIHYFFAYKELMDKDWDKVLRDYIPQIAAAADSAQYDLALREMYSHIQDGHGFIQTPWLLSQYGGAPPIIVRMIENQLVVTAFVVDSVARALGIEIGDIITTIDGALVAERLEQWEKYISGSNANWRRSWVAWRLLDGVDGTTLEVKLVGEDGREKTVSIPRQQAWRSVQYERANERYGTAVIRILPENIGYVDLDRLRQDQVDTMFEQLEHTKAIIFDMRGYPQGTAWSIAPRLTEQRNVKGAFFQRYVALGPDIPSAEEGLTGFVKKFFYQPIPHSDKWKYKGKTVMLIDERTMSQAEHTGLFFEAANGTQFIGSQTAGANGDVTKFLVPGGITLYFSGHDVRHADGRQLQQTGLVPHLEVRPTIAGIRAGRDEVLEKAVEFLTLKN